MNFYLGRLNRMNRDRRLLGEKGLGVVVVVVVVENLN